MFKKLVNGQNTLDEEVAENPSPAGGNLPALNRPDVSLITQTHGPGTLTTGEHPVEEIPDFSEAILQTGESLVNNKRV